jgi:peptide/nickel transport system permease protein
MWSYIVRRLAWAVLLLFVVFFITFFIFYILPSADPAKQQAGRAATKVQIDNIRRQQGLDKPFYEQFWLYTKRVVTDLDFGNSIQPGTPEVKDQILDRIPATVSLTLGAVVIWLTAAFAVGVVSAIKRRTWIDRLAMGTALVFVSAPVFWLGLIALYLFSKDLGTLWPVFEGQGSYAPISEDFGQWFNSLILPWFVLAGTFAAIYARVLRSSLIDVMGEDYIRTARAKGLSERRVIFKHGVRSAVTPVVTLLGIDLGVLLGGAILTETVFVIPGLGRESFQAIEAGDLPIVQGVVVFSASAIILLNLLVDIAYAYLDPRVRYA